MINDNRVIKVRRSHRRREGERWRTAGRKRASGKTRRDGEEEGEEGNNVGGSEG